MTKLNPTGTALVYSTYLDGSGAGAGHRCGRTGNAYVTGNLVVVSRHSRCLADSTVEVPANTVTPS